MNQYYVHILTNYTKNVLYIGVTNDLERRIFEHKNNLIDGFTKQYNTHCLIYFEETNHIIAAIVREKQLKGWVRKKKDTLINKMNSEWKDLSENWFDNC